MPSTGNTRLRLRRRFGHRAARIGFLRRAAARMPLPSGDRRMRRNEILSSTSVILAGVFVVVGFAYIATRALHNDASPAPIRTTPAITGNAGLPSALNQDLIPLQSASPTPSPTTPAAPPPDPGALAVARSDVPGTVNLSAEGSSDWVHWGASGTFALERDKSGDFAILEGAPTAPRFRHEMSPQLFTWTGGDPIASSSGTPTGIRTCGKGNGFTITAPAGTGSRTLKLYVGAIASKGRLDASLSTGKATGSITLDQHDQDIRTAVLTVTYRAPKDGKLRLSWSTQDTYGGGCAGVALEAATLR